MVELMIALGDWLLNTVWPIFRDVDNEAWHAGIAGGIFTTAMALSIFGVFSRITDFIFNAGIILFIVMLGSMPTGLYLSAIANAETMIGTIYMTATGALIFLLYALFVIIPTAFTIYALYKGEENMNMPQAWSTSS